jgi:hypothetical protein
MAEACDIGRMIQRVIDDKYPSTRLLWQGFQPETAIRPAASTKETPAQPRAVTAATTRPPHDPRYLPDVTTRGLDSRRSLPTVSRRTAEEKREALDRVVQRVVDMKYPETRLVWMRSREDPGYLRSRQLAYGPRPGEKLSNVVRPRTSPLLH